jgi:heme oxygenase
MALKELTKEKHAEAESTAFMKAVFARSLPQDLWIDWTKQKSLFYNVIENYADQLGLLEDLPGIKRSYYLFKDYTTMNGGQISHTYRHPVIEYVNYLHSIGDDSKKILSHLYTWHMGDMFGGQMIKKVVPGSHYNLEFEDIPTLMTNFRKKLSDDLAEEAFEWAIKMMKDYDNNLVQN